MAYVKKSSKTKPFGSTKNQIRPAYSTPREVWTSHTTAANPSANQSHKNTLSNPEHYSWLPLPQSHSVADPNVMEEVTNTTAGARVARKERDEEDREVTRKKERTDAPSNH